MRDMKDSYLTYKNIIEKKYVSNEKKLVFIPLNLKNKCVKVCTTLILSVVMLVSVTFPYASVNSESDVQSNDSQLNNEKISKEDSAKVAEYCAKAKLCADKSDNNEAVKYLTKAIELESDDDELYYNRAAFFVELKKYNRAIEDYQKALKYKSDNNDIYFILANLFYNKKDFDKACVYYTKALDYESREDVLYPLASSYLQLEKYEESINYLNEYINLNESNKKEAIYSRAVAYMLNEDYKNAIKDLNESILLKYNTDMCNLYMAECYYSMEIYDKAISYYEEYFRNCPENCKDMSNLAVCYYNCSKYDDAKKWFEKCLNNNIDVEMSNYYLGVINLEEKSYSDAITCFNSCLEAEYRQEYCLYNRGVAYLYNSEKEKAKGDFQEVLRISKDEKLNNMAREALACL